MISNPIVIDPPDMDIHAAWKQCDKWVKGAGGLFHDDGEPNWRAAFSADPGCVTCPACGETYWAWGRRHRCVKCGFEYPTDWWPMYSYGVHAAKSERGRYKHEERLSHPYYRYGFEHPVDDAWEQHDKINWRAAMARASKGE